MGKIDTFSVSKMDPFCSSIPFSYLSSLSSLLPARMQRVQRARSHDPRLGGQSRLPGDQAKDQRLGASKLRELHDPIHLTASRVHDRVETVRRASASSAQRRGAGLRELYGSCGASQGHARPGESGVNSEVEEKKESQSFHKESFYYLKVIIPD